MNNMKKLASLLLAMIMLLAVAAPAMALEEPTGYTITINDALEGHTYTAYQIFKGDLHESTLSNITWGDGVNTGASDFPYKDKTAAEVAETITTKEEAAAFADVIGKYLTTTSSASATVAEDAKSCELSVQKAGYYLIKNDTVPVENGAYTAYILEVVKNVATSAKVDVPEVEKKVKDTNDSVANSTTDWQDSADYDIGDEIPFQLTGTITEKYDDYETYYYAFHDEQSAGLTFNAASVKVYVGETQITTGFEVKTTGLQDGCTFEVVFANLKSVTEVKAGSKITVEYTSTLNSNAVIGSAGNPNEVYLEYSNNPNAGGEGDHGKTPEDKVIVFTFDVVANKVDESQKPLVGASFTLYKKLNTLPEGAEATGYEVETVDGQNIYWWNLGTVDGTNGTTFKWKGLDDGEYKLVETHTPAGYNTIDPIYFTVSAEHEEKAADPKLESLNVTSSMDTKNEDGTTKLAFTANKDKSEETISTTVINKKGVNLPSTGGMGTTLFYLMGAVLLAGAAVVVVSKKRAIEK